MIRNVAEENFGGGEIYQLNLAKALKESGFEPVILTNSRELIKRAKGFKYKILVPPYIKRQNWSGIYNMLLPIYIFKINKLKKWYEEIFNKYKTKIINVQSRDDFIAATLAAKKCGIKVLWTDHADFKSWILVNVRVRFKNIIGKIILGLSNEVERVIFVSQAVFDETKKMVYPNKIKNAEVIENGVLDNYSEYEDIKPQKDSFVFIGRVVEDKGIEELIKAFCVVRKKYPNAVLNIYGNGDVSKYQEIAGDGVKFHGETEEPLKALAENEFFVLPSYKEGLSLSLLDAAMMGKTIIASDVDGNPEAVENGVSGLLVPAKNVEKLAEAMERVLIDPKFAKKLAQGARRKYENEFNFEQIFVKKMLPLYNSGKEKK